jgi:dienelactone hydrolase
MGAIILIAALAIEVALAAYCIATKSSQNRVRSFVRVGALAAFVAFALASVIEWGFRWYGLAALLFVWSALGARTLLRSKGKGEKYGAGRVVFGAIGTLALLFVALTPALIFPQHRSPAMTGGHKVSTVEYTYADEGRAETFTNTGEKRKVNVEFWYPQDADGTYPLVVFSHGAFGMKTSNTSTFMELASNGYVVCSIDHPYHSLYTKGTDGKVIIADASFRQEIMDTNNGVYDDEAELRLYQKWMKVRTADIGFVLDTIAERAKDTGSEGVYRHVDTARIGLIGHSLGGAASAQVGRERNDIDAVINLDADLLGEYQGVAAGKPVINDKVYPIPLLSIYSDDMTQLFARVADPNSVIPGKHIAATAPAAYEIYIAGTNHMSLTDVPIVLPLLVTVIGDPKNTVHQYEADKYYVIETMNARVLEFFDAYLKGKGSFTSAGTY